MSIWSNYVKLSVNTKKKIFFLVTARKFKLIAQQALGILTTIIQKKLTWLISVTRKIFKKNFFFHFMNFSFHYIDI